MGDGKTQAIVMPARRGPVEGRGILGVDQPPERRPGVPLDAVPSAAEGVEGRPLAAQTEQRERRLHRTALDGPTPVFGTAQPRWGLSGALRSAAYAIPEHRARHWMLLLFADRVDVAGDRVGRALAMPLEAVGAHGAAARIRARPSVAAAAVIALAAAAAGVWLAKRLGR